MLITHLKNMEWFLFYIFTLIDLYVMNAVLNSAEILAVVIHPRLCLNKTENLAQKIWLFLSTTF